MDKRVQGGACDLYVFERDVEMKRHETPCLSVASRQGLLDSKDMAWPA